MPPRPAAPPIGRLPRLSDLNTEGLTLSAEARETLLSLDLPAWHDELGSIAVYLDELGPRVPQALRRECERVAASLAAYEAVDPVDA